MKPGLVSVIVPVYNRAVYLRHAVDSVLAQDDTDFEILLVDDGSSDDTCDEIARLADEQPRRIRTVRIENRGPGGAREAGRCLAQGEFIQYLDSDDLLMPGKFKTQVRALRENSDCDIAYGITRLIDDEGRELACPYKDSGTRHGTLFPRLLVDRWWNTHTPLYRRSLCDRIGPWATTRMGEDWEYDARAGALGAKLAFCDQVVSCHRQHGQGRLTGGELTAAAVRDIAYLIPRLFACAEQAGVNKDLPEMRHFSRWAFLVARQCAGFGLIPQAEACLAVAKRAELRPSASLYLSECLVRLIGWRAFTKLAGLRDRTHRCFSVKAGRLKTNSK